MCRKRSADRPPCAAHRAARKGRRIRSDSRVCSWGKNNRSYGPARYGIRANSFEVSEGGGQRLDAAQIAKIVVNTSVPGKPGEVGASATGGGDGGRKFSASLWKTPPRPPLQR